MQICDNNKAEWNKELELDMKIKQVTFHYLDPTLINKHEMKWKFLCKNKSFIHRTGMSIV